MNADRPIEILLDKGKPAKDSRGAPGPDLLLDGTGLGELQLSGWDRSWGAEVGALFELLQEAGRDDAGAAELLARIRRLREATADLPDPALRSLARQLLDEVWEATRASIYGDLESVRECAGRARELARRARDFPARHDF